jgi:hypothetical protein
MWIARYLLLRLCERYGVDVNIHPKPLGADLDWNGSGMHTNFSTKYMRETGGKEYFDALMAAFAAAQDDHIAVYGAENHLRLTGLHETQAIDTFSFGVADRGASIRVPHSFVQSGYRGYLEDRRPNSQADPYQVTGRIVDTIARSRLPGRTARCPRAVAAAAAAWTSRRGRAAGARLVAESTRRGVRERGFAVRATGAGARRDGAGRKRSLRFGNACTGERRC